MVGFLAAKSISLDALTEAAGGGSQVLVGVALARTYESRVQRHPGLEAT